MWLNDIYFFHRYLESNNFIIPEYLYNKEVIDKLKQIFTI
jgi:hypothetical protein